MNIQNGIVYVLTNPAMPGIVKIGFTRRDKIEDRLNELFNATGVPVPFKCEFACKVEDCNKVEKALHAAFGPNRVHPQREFFTIKPEQAIVILRLLGEEIQEITKEITKEINSLTSKADKDASKKLEKLRSPSLNFAEMNIPVGARLKFVKNSSIEVEVVSDKKVKYHNEILSLTGATKRALDIKHSVHPCPNWSYKGESLSNIYDKTYIIEEQ